MIPGNGNAVIPTLDPMFEIVSNPSRGLELHISDDVVANEFEVYLKEQRYVFFERRPESKHIRLLFGEAACEKAVDDLVKAFQAHRTPGL